MLIQNTRTTLVSVHEMKLFGDTVFGWKSTFHRSTFVQKKEEQFDGQSAADRWRYEEAPNHSKYHLEVLEGQTQSEINFVLMFRSQPHWWDCRHHTPSYAVPLCRCIHHESQLAACSPTLIYRLFMGHELIEDTITKKWLKLKYVIISCHQQKTVKYWNHWSSYQCAISSHTISSATFVRRHRGTHSVFILIDNIWFFDKYTMIHKVNVTPQDQATSMSPHWYISNVLTSLSAMAVKGSCCDSPSGSRINPIWHQTRYCVPYWWHTDTSTLSTAW